MFREMQSVIGKVHALQANASAKNAGKLPGNAYFLNQDEIVCYTRAFGDSRYPYTFDGLTLWAYASGNVKIEESAFQILLDCAISREPNLAAFFGLQSGSGFLPVSITGAARQAVESGVERYTVFTPFAAYYVAETSELDGCVKLSVDGNKNVRTDICLCNKTHKAVTTYLSAFLKCHLFHSEMDGFPNKWFQACRADRDGFLFTVNEQMSRTVCATHYAAVRRTYAGEVQSTVSPSDFFGDSVRGLYAAKSLFTGKIPACKRHCEFTEAPVAADMLPLELEAGENVTAMYTLAVADDEQTAQSMSAKPENKIENVYANLPALKIATDGSINETAVTCFLHNVLRQTEFCARAKNYAGALIGIRDIFQQLECALWWIPAYCRGKMVEALGFIGEDGRAPRQYTYPRSKDVPPIMDLRKFIDQGVWVISTVYTYLAATDDFSILDETCGYYKLGDGTAEFSCARDSVLDHLLRIADYLISHLDEETNCLHALYGDWNDALDGLGNTNDAGKEFGTGVSVMATMQLYKNLNELCEILSHEHTHLDKVSEYKAVAERIAKGLQTYAIDGNGAGDKKIVHGWGDKRSYKVGSFCDNDGESRDSATSNAFWVLSGMNDRQDMKEHILRAFERLDSKYGIKTFEPYFAPDNDKVGRIIRLPKGTAENAATYIHATLFAVWALYELGEYVRAEVQLRKILPITHSFVSTTPFVMPNSYSHNEEKGMDGESMGDWFTGSGAVLGKVLFFGVLGIKADLNGITFAPAVNTLFTQVQITLPVKGGTLTAVYKNLGRGTRKYTVNGTAVAANTDKIHIKNEEIHGKHITVEIVD